MRIDKFLKVSRLIKRRTMAKKACSQERVKINGKVVKASTDVAIGDEITLDIRDTEIKVKVKDIKEHVKKGEAEELYRII